MKALRRWREVSWFLDDEDAHEASASQELPKSWRLGNRPNLKQMHDEACRERVTSDAVDAALADAIRKARNSLTGGAKATGAKGALAAGRSGGCWQDDSICSDFVILGPDAVSDSGRPSALAKRYLAETTGPKPPARDTAMPLVLAVPSRDGLDAMRASARTLLGWEDVSRATRKTKPSIPLRAERLRRELAGSAQPACRRWFRQGYAVVVSVERRRRGRTGVPSGGRGRAAVHRDQERRTFARIKETAIDAEALLPDGPFDLWRGDEEARFVKDLANAFARDPRLPKMLNAGVVLDTVLQGVERGLFVARLARPDGSGRTWWRVPVEDEARQDPTLEVVLPHTATLSNLPLHLLAPDALPRLWEGRPPRLGARPALFLRRPHASPSPTKGGTSTSRFRVARKRRCRRR